MTKVALIVGVTGQDGAYLARLLHQKGYDVHGTSRTPELSPLDGLSAVGVRKHVKISSLWPTDLNAVVQKIEQIRPDEIYNLAGQSSVALSFAEPAQTIDSVVVGTLNFLEALRKAAPSTRFYNAGSSECFGDTGERAADESTPFCPKSPYGIAKVAAVSLVSNYRDAYGLFACSGLLFNHESPLRPDRFVTRKITAAAARIAGGSKERLVLSTLSIRRDWGWAPDYVEAMWKMLQQHTADDFVIASGQSHSLEDFVTAAFGAFDLNWRDHVVCDPSIGRPNDIVNSVGNPEKALQRLGWKPTVQFREMINRMAAAECVGVAAD
jgi:GDPmannose 4,6-dehydratase